jgi:hypothetical protein
MYQIKGVAQWVFKVVVVVDSVDREKCTRLFALTAKKNVKFPLSPEKTVLSIARTAFQSTRSN